MDRPSSTRDNGQFNTSSYAEGVLGDYEMAPQYDHDQKSHHLAARLRVSEAMIRVANRPIDDMHVVMADYCQRASVAQQSSDGGFSMDDFHTLRERVSVMRTDYQQLLTHMDYLLRISEMYHEALRDQELEMDRITQELESTRGFLRGTQIALLESEYRSDESLKEIHQRSTSSVLVDTQMYQPVTLTEDVDDLTEEHQLLGDTSICVLGVVDLHIDIDPAARPGSVMQHEFAGDDRSMSEHTVMSDSSQRHAEMYRGIQRGALPSREETHLGEHACATPLQQHMIMRPHLHHLSSCLGEGRWRVVYQQLEELLPIVPYDWGLVMTTGEKLSWIPMDELLVKSLGLTKACDAFQSYSQLLMFLIACPGTFIIDNNMRRDRLWLRAWRMSSSRLHDRSTFTTYSRSEVDCVRQTIETWYVTVSIIDQVMTDERKGLQTVISPAQE
jgi:hypothetical protein